MEEAGLRAFYRHIRSPGDPGEPAHARVAPGEGPDSRCTLFPSPPPAQQ